MRDIKFKAKELEKKNWVIGCLATYPNGNVRIFHTSTDGKPHCGLYNVDPLTVGQYTGKTDGSGRLIYEHDILHNPEFQCDFTVVWSNDYSGFFAKVDSSMENFEEYCCNGAFVIGNLFDGIDA